MDDDQLLMPAEVARIFRVNASTVSQWGRSGKLRSIMTVGGHRRFRKSDVERAIAEMRRYDDCDL